MVKYILKSNKQVNNNAVFTKNLHKPYSPVYGNNKFENTFQENFPFNNIFNVMVNPVVCRDKNGMYLYINRAFEELVGIPAKEIVGLTSLEMSNNFSKRAKGRTAINNSYFQRAIGEWDKIGMEILRSGGTRTLEQEIVFSDGIKRIFIVNFTAFNNGKEGVQGLVIVLQDVTEFRKSKNAFEEKMQESEDKYRSFVQNLKGIAFQFDRNFKLEFMHGAVEEITGYGEEELVSSKLWHNLIEPEDLSIFREKESKIKQCSCHCQGELDYRIRCKNGKIKWMRETYQKVPGKEGKPDVYNGIIYDITERKEAEETLAKVEIARKKEVHHRIKNNLQVISSLLDLQAENIGDERIKEVLRESQNRIMSIALIHRELYRDREMNNVNFSTYIRELAENLLDTYKIGDSRISLDMDLEENIFFDVETAVPLGIIVNEIFSNSLKYAFPDRAGGEIRISLVMKNKEESEFDSFSNGIKQGIEGGANFVLTISDNGVGIPETFKMGTTDTLGLQLINVLVEQLDGSIRLNRTGGTEFIIDFAAQDFS